MNYYPTFKYIEVGNIKSPWKRIQIADLDSHGAQFNNIDFCKSIARYSNPEPQDKEPILMGIAIDLDDDNLENVLKEARLLQEYFCGTWELKKE
ncbi:MAG: hypothetical protein AAB089_06690, partial [Nitrospirota bacterium]